MRVNCHNGRDRSKPVMASCRAKSSTVAGVCGFGASRRRRCRERSKFVSIQRGFANRAGGSTGRWRNRGASRVARSSRAESASKSGDRSSQVTATIVARRPGSFSRYHENASVSRMNTSSRSFTESLPEAAVNDATLARRSRLGPKVTDSRSQSEEESPTRGGPWTLLSNDPVAGRRLALSCGQQADAAKVVVPNGAAERTRCRVPPSGGRGSPHAHCRGLRLQWSNAIDERDRGADTPQNSTSSHAIASASARYLSNLVDRSGPMTPTSTSDITCGK